MSGFRLDDSVYRNNWFSDVCSLCKNLTDGIDRKCRAFDKIPLTIWEGRNNHRKPYRGDNGIQFDPIKE